MSIAPQEKCVKFKCPFQLKWKLDNDNKHFYSNIATVVSQNKHG
jgi:hypothetical protein